MRKLKNLISAIAAAVVFASLSVCAFADVSYDFTDENLVTGWDCKEKVVTATSCQLTGDLQKTHKGISTRIVLFNEMQNPEYWNNDNVYVTAEVRLETPDVEAIAQLAGMDTTWRWFEGTDKPVLPYNEWVTITETGKHFYEKWASLVPNQILIDVRGTSSTETFKDVTVSFRNFQIVGPAVTAYQSEVPEETTNTEPEVTEPEETQPEVTEPEVTEPEVTEPEETEPEETEPEVTEPEATEPSQAEPEDTKPEEKPAESVSPAPDNGKPASTAAPVTAVDGTIAEREEASTDMTTIIIVAVIVAVVVIGAAAAGVIFFKKKK